MALFVVWWSARASSVAVLVVVAGAWLVILASVWLWIASQHPSIYDTAPYAIVLLAAGTAIAAAGCFWYSRERRKGPASSSTPP